MEDLLAARRLIALAVAVAAAAGGVFAQGALKHSAEVQLEAAARQSASLAADRAGDTLALAHRGLQPRAAAVAALTGVPYLLRQHVDVQKDVRDQLLTESSYKPFSDEFPVIGVVTGGPEQFIRGATPEAFEKAGLVESARRNGAASALVIIAGKAWLAASAPMTVPGWTRPPPVLVIAQPLDSKALASIDWPKAAGSAVLLADGSQVLGEAGVADGLAVLERLQAKSSGPREAHDDGWHWAAVARSVGPDLWLSSATDVSALAAATMAPLATTRALIWGAVGLCIAAALALGFRRKPAPEPAAPIQTLDRTQVSLPRAGQTPPQGSGAPSTGVTSPLNAPIPLTALAPGGTQFGRYLLVHQLGSGGMGDVYLAVAFGAEGFRRNFVVKRLRPELARDPRLVSQFVDEARLASQLVHSNIVPVFDFGRMGEELFMAQEYISGRDLERLTARSLEVDGRPLPAHLVYYAAQQVLQALSYAHGKADDQGKPMELVHRDVSPQNVMVSARGEVKLLDFGIVKTSSPRTNQTEAGVVKGNVVFMAPEQARGEPVDRRADLYSLGLVLFRCLSGRMLYTEDTAYKLLVHAANGLSDADRALVAQLPSPAAEIVARALAVDRAQRFQSAEEFAAALPQPRPGDAQEFSELVERLFGSELAVERGALAGAAPAAAGGAA